MGKNQLHPELQKKMQHLDTLEQKIKTESGKYITPTEREYLRKNIKFLKNLFNNMNTIIQKENEIIDQIQTVSNAIDDRKRSTKEKRDRYLDNIDKQIIEIKEQAEAGVAMSQRLFGSPQLPRSDKEKKKDAEYQQTSNLTLR